MKFQDRVLRFVGFPRMAHAPPRRAGSWPSCRPAI